MVASSCPGLEISRLIPRGKSKVHAEIAGMGEAL
jgi:hypothetical protein